MLLIRLLAVSLVLTAHSGLLSPTRPDALRRYKRAIAQRADRLYSSLAGEPCAVSGARSSRRQPRSVLPPRHRPPAARPRTHTSRRDAAAAVCAGGCRVDRGSWADRDDVGLGDKGRYVTLTEWLYKKRSTRDEKVDTRLAGTPAREDAGQGASSWAHAESPRRSRHRSSRSLDVTFPYDREDNSSSDKVFYDTSTDSAGLRVLHVLQQGDGDHHSSVEDGTEDYSGEVEEADPRQGSLPAGSPLTWGSQVPRVPPSWMSALYFHGRREQLRLKPTAGVELPRATFSLELWVKPEGGQSNPALIAGGCYLVTSASYYKNNKLHKVPPESSV